MKTRSLICFISLVLISGVFAQQENPSAALTETLTKYAAAVQHKNLSGVEKYVVPTDAFTMFEGGHVNWGWVDYRDHHPGPEMKEFKEIQYSFNDIKTRVSPDFPYFKTTIRKIGVKWKRAKSKAMVWPWRF